MCPQYYDDIGKIQINFWQVIILETKKSDGTWSEKYSSAAKVLTNVRITFNHLINTIKTIIQSYLFLKENNLLLVEYLI